jgi:hypothetical protein
MVILNSSMLPNFEHLKNKLEVTRLSLTVIYTISRSKDNEPPPHAFVTSHHLV